MWYVIVLVLTLIILALGLDIKIKDVKKIKNLEEDRELTNLSNKFPENKKICEDILEMIDNKEVKIEETKDEKSQTSLYLVMSNKILIANIKNNFTRIQTIAHECIHSIQNKKLLMFNFIFSNLNILYFIIICILAIFKIGNKEITNILFIALFLLQFILFTVRNFLETDAMTRAEFLAEKYIHKTKMLGEKEETLLCDEYKNLNKIGIKLYMFVLTCKMITKLIIYELLLIINI